MTEVASLLPADHRLTSVRHYEAGPPPGLELVEPGETVATTKEEEWVSKKKTEVTNTKQIETRVKRQVVLEDGKVVEDSGPVVTSNTTEDTETHEHHQTELRKLGDDEDDQKALEGLPDGTIVEKSNWVAVANPDGVVREVKERRVVSREETEEVKETEDVQHLGDITDEQFLAAVRSGRSDLRQVLRSNEGGQALVSTGPRLIRDTSKSNKVIDTEDTRELSSVRPDGKIITETQRTTEHEEVNDDECPDDVPDQNYEKESSQRFKKTREQEDVDYIANGVNIGHEMRFKTETMEVERRGDGMDEVDFDSLSARVRRRTSNIRQQPHRYRGLENGGSPLDRKDALTRRPLDFDQEEETRKVETSKWLEHHFGSESRSSSNSLVDDEEQAAPKTSFFNVTIKSQPSPRPEPAPQKTYTSNMNNNSQRVYSPVEPERDRNHQSGYYKGISEWSERQERHHQEHYAKERRSPLPYHRSPSPVIDNHRRFSPAPDYRHHQQSPVPDYLPRHSPVPDYRAHSPTPDYGRGIRRSPKRDVVTPTPPQRKRTNDRQRQRVVEERTRYDSGYRSRRDDSRERIEEPPPDYSPPSPPPMPSEKKPMQKTRFAADPPKAKSGNIIGQSIRKLVGKIRSASAERKAKQRAKRSPSPSYQQGHVIDSNIGHTMERQPVQRYYLGEDPFGGSIYGRENKYEGVKPARSSRKPREEDRRSALLHNKVHRSQSTLGRFSKSTGRLVNASIEERNSQTLPRHLSSKHEVPTRLEKSNRSNSTINVSIINTVSTPRIVNDGPAKPARTYKSNLSRSKSLNVHAEDLNSRNMYTSNPQVHRLDEKPIGLKSPGLISSLNRSPDVSEEVYTSRFSTTRNGTSETADNKRVFMSTLKDRAPELFKTLHETETDSWKPQTYKTITTTTSSRNYNGDIYEPPTRLRDTQVFSSPQHSVIRRGSNSSTDFSETYHTTTRNDDPNRPSVTNTTTSVSKKTIPSKDGRSMETIESKETRSVTKSHYRGGNEPIKFYETERRYSSSGSNPVVIEVRNYRK
ncbi:serine/arginine repetitive matrix protein 2 isoform X2 [Aethina tumida]|uniref:serine/arginine repetitive matrix protein 2 isoform X2 n=1 Tax=Aethina tumida TaxID=116153 RepID=UPI0021485E80|nr:serine/arginine repetitive matrix protein 2 isoform X2 [Aethina tumida]